MEHHAGDEPVRDVESDKEVVEAVLHVRREGDTNAGDVPSKTNTPNNDGQDSKNKRKLKEELRWIIYRIIEGMYVFASVCMYACAYFCI